MTQSIFFAWQSDIEKRVSKNFIRKALDKAIRKINIDLMPYEAMRSSQDTEDVPGSPDVAQTIFGKIETSAAFICDITTVYRKDRRALPNPNVMIEYGWAMAKLKDHRIIMVFNEAYGDGLKDRPFDMVHKRGPITYHLPAGSDEETKQSELVKLVPKIAQALKAIAALPPVGAMATKPAVASFDFARETYFSARIPDHHEGRQIGYWVGAIPVGVEIDLGRVYRRPELMPYRSKVEAEIGAGQAKTFAPMDELRAELLGTPTPVPGGVSVDWWHRYSPSLAREKFFDDLCRISVGSNGQIGLVAKTNNIDDGPCLRMEWIIADIANVLRIIKQVRDAAGAQVPYALMVELRYDDHGVTEVHPVTGGIWALPTILDERVQPNTTFVKSDPYILGPHLVGNSDAWSSFLEERLIDLFELARTVPNFPKASFTI